MKSPRIELAIHPWWSYGTTAELSSNVTNSLTVSVLDATGAHGQTTVMRLLADQAGRRLPLAAAPPHLFSSRPRAAAAVEAAAAVAECTQPRRAT